MKSYSVNVWGSKPGDNDDCWYGSDYATRDEAVAAFNADPVYCGNLDTSSPWIEIDGPDIHEERRNPNFRAPRRSEIDEWRHEIEREHLMLHGSLDR